jgi:hypothetical protein
MGGFMGVLSDSRWENVVAVYRHIVVMRNNHSDDHRSGNA